MNTSTINKNKIEKKTRISSSILYITLGASSGTLFLWLSSYAFPEGDINIGRAVFGNIPKFIQYSFYLTTIVTILITGYLFSLRSKNWERGLPERRNKLFGARLIQLFKALNMDTVRRFKAAGLMHSLIYIGFVILFIGTVTLEIHHLLPPNFKFLQGLTYQIYSAILDAASLMYIYGLTWALYRRLFTSEERIRSKTLNDDYLTLFVLLFIGISGLAIEAARISLMNRPYFEIWSFVGYPLSFLIPNDIASQFHQISWVLHVLSFFVFLILLPVTKLRHIITSPVNMYLSPTNKHKGAMSDMGNLLEATDIENIGVSNIEDFTWKQLFDLDACTVCGRCTSVCPANATGKQLDPREIVLKIGQVMSESGSPPVSATVSNTTDLKVSSSSVFELITPEEIWACTSCKACDEICPVNIEILDKILDIRRHLALMASEFPAELGKAYVAMENSSNPWGSSQEKRLDWTKELDFDVPVLGQPGTETAEYLYWIGCAGAFDDRNIHVTRAVATLLHRANISYAVLGPKEQCTGDSARRTGNEFVYQQLAIENINTMNSYNIKKVITQCPHCFNTIANEYPQLGGDYEVIHHSQLLTELVSSGRIEVGTSENPYSITYHDSC